MYIALGEMSRPEENIFFSESKTLDAKAYLARHFLLTFSSALGKELFLTH